MSPNSSFQPLYLCTVCHQNEVYFDLKRNTATPYCSRTCKNIGEGTYHNTSHHSQHHPHAPPSRPTDQMCAWCHSRPTIMYNNAPSPYCGKTCASTARNAPYTGAIAPSPMQIHLSHMRVESTNIPLATVQTMLPKRSPEMCLECKGVGKLIMQNDNSVSDWCGQTCKGKADSRAPTLYNLDSNSYMYKSVATQFNAKWNIPSGRTPTIHLIWRVHVKPGVEKAYELYRQSVENNRECTTQLLPNGKPQTAGNEQRRWHGTSVDSACQVGYEAGNDNICDSASCAVCRIMENSYDIGRAAIGMMGAGIYFSSTSSKSNDYNRGSAKTVNNKKLKCMFLNKVVVGSTKKYGSFTVVKKSDLGTQFDSVCLDPQNCNLADEVVVFDSSACIPRYLVVYEPL